MGCGMANNIYVLIVLRAIQAAGGAGFTPSATGIVVDHFGKERDRALGLFGSIFPIGAMIGPVFGGLFVSYWSWRGVFYVNVPIGLVAMVLAFRYVPRDRPAAGGIGSSPDVTGMALLAGGLLAGMVAASYLGEGNAHPWSPAFLMPLAIGLFVKARYDEAADALQPHMAQISNICLALLIVLTGVDAVMLTEYAVIFSAVALPLTYIPILLVANDRAYMGALTNGRVANVLGFFYLLLIMVIALTAIPLMILTNVGQN